MIEMTESLARAVLEVEEICTSEGLGPTTDEDFLSWLGLLKEAVAVLPNRKPCMWERLLACEVEIHNRQHPFNCMG